MNVKRSKMLGVRVTPEMSIRARQIAAREDVSVSNWIYSILDTVIEMEMLGSSGEEMATKETGDISKREYTLYHWIEVTEASDLRRCFIRGKERTPEEAFFAAQHYDAWKMASDGSEDAV